MHSKKETKNGAHRAGGLKRISCGCWQDWHYSICCCCCYCCHRICAYIGTTWLWLNAFWLSLPFIAQHERLVAFNSSATPQTFCYDNNNKIRNFFINISFIFILVTSWRVPSTRYTTIECVCISLLTILAVISIITTKPTTTTICSLCCIVISRTNNNNNSWGQKCAHCSSCCWCFLPLHVIVLADAAAYLFAYSCWLCASSGIGYEHISGCLG